MPTYFIVDGVKIELYYNDHNPPHFHARIAEHDAIISIEMAEILHGTLPSNKISFIKKWAEENRTTLQAIWNELRKK